MERHHNSLQNKTETKADYPKVFCEYTDLMAYVRVHADELHLGNIYDVVDVVTMNSGGFRLVFDANYQNGWRPKYADYIDADTGEIKKGLGSVERV